ncbi:MAG: acyl-CoA thioesterase [Caldilineaceae bacterium]|nr:acyl-CoA thioesterase [Caldilineaceae bacterium]MCB0140087.1 acyl-CoA thioesterase [Caldilineaceae bacterium]MCB9152339.1 acyl-CoA thioesterase [Caldilineaceae bacterium]
MSHAELSEAVVSTEISVRFAETDSMGVVHHAAYIVWFEVGRVAWLNAAGMPYKEIAQGGNHFAVTGVNAIYRAASTFGDVLCIQTRLTKLRSRQVSFAYEIRHRDSGELCVTGSSDHICVDLQGRMSKLPQAVLDRLWEGANALK